MGFSNRIAENFSNPSIKDISSIVTLCHARNIPTVLIDQNIGWLERQKKDIDFTINQLEQVKKTRQRTENHRKMMNDLARQFYDGDALGMDRETRILIIIQRLGCDRHRAESLCDLIEKWAKRKQRENRNEEICVQHAAGKTITAIAREHKISRQQVYNIIEKSDRYNYLRTKKRA